MSKIIGIDLGTTNSVVSVMQGGDPVVRQVLEEVGVYLGMAIASVVNMTNPAAVVLGGYFAAVADFIIPVIERTIRENAMAPLCKDLRLLVSTFGQDAVPVGGVALAMEAFLSNRAQVIEMRPARAIVSGRHVH